MKYTVTQRFSTENDTEVFELDEFSTKKEALKHFHLIKNNSQQGGQVITEVRNNKTDDIIEEHSNEVDYTNDYGKLVISYTHEGKGMNYCHKFVQAFWLDENNCKNLSDNPDKRFSLWHMILNLTFEELNELYYDDAVSKFKDEARLKWNNSVDLEDLGLTFKDLEDDN